MARAKSLCRRVHGVSLAERLEAYSIPEPNSGCLLWLGGMRNGYGRVSVPGGGTQKRGAHVVAWELHCGRPVPSGLDVLHKCDNPGCIEPTHLKLGTHQDNMDDKVARGRQARMVGSEHPAAKLDENQALSIRHDNRPLAVLAAMYGVSESTISLIRRRKTWAHLQ